MTNLFKGLVKLTEEQYQILKQNGTITVGDKTINYDTNTLYVTDYAIDKVLDINSSNPVENKAITQALNEKANSINVVTIDSNQEITGNKDFKGKLTYNNENVALQKDIPIVSDNLNTEDRANALAVNQGIILNNKITSLIENVNGKVKAFAVNNLADLGSLFNIQITEVKDEYNVSVSSITYKEKEYNLITGDSFYIIDTEVPDYWFSLDDMKLYKMETQKVDLTNYATIDSVNKSLDAKADKSSLEETNSNVTKNTNDIANLKANQKTKLSEMEEDSNHRTVSDTQINNWDSKLDSNALDGYATQDYVLENGGKIDKIFLNEVEQEIVNKEVHLNIDVPETITDYYKIKNKLIETNLNTIVIPGNYGVADDCTNIPVEENGTLFVGLYNNNQYAQQLFISASNNIYTRSSQDANNTTWSEWVTYSPYSIMHKDTRNNNQTPSWYFTYCPKRTVWEFKGCWVLGITGEFYVVLMTHTPWSNESGGLPTQIAFAPDGEMYVRAATSTTTWGSWSSLVVMKNNAISVDTINGKTKGNALIKQDSVNGNIYVGSELQKLTLKTKEARPKAMIYGDNTEEWDIALLTDTLSDDKKAFVSKEYTKSANELDVPNIDSATESGITYSLVNDVVTVVGTKTTAGTFLKSLGFCECKAETDYVAAVYDSPDINVAYLSIAILDADKQWIDTKFPLPSVKFTTPSNAAFFELRLGVETSEYVEKQLPVLVKEGNEVPEQWSEVYGEIIHRKEFETSLNSKADKNDIPKNVVTTDTEQAINGRKLFGNKIEITTSDNNYIPTREKIGMVINEDGTIYYHNDIDGANLRTTLKFDSEAYTYSTATLPAKTGTIAMTSDIPKNLSELTEDSTHRVVTDLEKLRWNNMPTQADLDEVYESIDSINAKIPSQASSTNQLADKDFVNSSIATSTAEFRGTYNSVNELPTSGVDANDYAFVKSTDSSGNTLFNRYKYNSSTSSWEFEYSLNNSSFTDAQWKAINSGATTTLINQITTNKQNIDLKENKANLKALAYKDSVSKSDVGLGNVDNTSDLNKPISTATQNALNNKATKSELANYFPKSGGTFTGKVKTNADFIILGAAADGHLMTRGIRGHDNSGDEPKTSDLYLNYSTDYGVYFGKTANGKLLNDGTIMENGTLLSNKYLGKTANAVSATKATQDGSGNNIVDTYAKKSDVQPRHYLSGDSGRTSGTYTYYKLASFPIDNSGNSCSLIINGRIGGWNKGNKGSISMIISNRDGVAGVGTILGNAETSLTDLVVYTSGSSSSGSTATLYVKTYSWFAFDLTLGLMSGTTDVWDGVGSTTTPSGTLAWSLSSAKTNFLQVKDDGNTYVKNTQVVLKGETVDFSNVTNVLNGFKNRPTAQTWGNQTGTYISGMNDETGGSIAFRRDNPSTGKLSMVIDGTVYVNEGNDEVATKKDVNLSNYLPLSGGNLTGNLGLSDGLITGEYNGTPEHHAIRIGIPNRDYCEFIEYGGDFRFIKRVEGTSTTVATITQSGITSHTGYFNASSDKRLKENIVDVNEETLKSFVENTPIKAFNYKSNGNRTIGIIAQDIENLDINGAKFTSTNDNGYLQVHETKFVYLLWNYCQQLNKRIKELESKVK